MSTLEKLKALDKERDSLITEAKKHTLGEIQEHIKVLAQLGFDYSLVENSPAKRKRRTKKEMKGG